MYTEQEKQFNPSLKKFLRNVAAITLIPLSVYVLGKNYKDRIDLVEKAPVIETKFTDPRLGYYGFYTSEDCIKSTGIYHNWLAKMREINDFQSDGTTLDGKIKVLDLDRDCSVGRLNIEKD